jgi:hypothetical protein
MGRTTLRNCRRTLLRTVCQRLGKLKGVRTAFGVGKYSAQRLSLAGGLYTHCGKVFKLIVRRFAICRPLQESLVGRRHENEDATEIRNLHRGGAECQAGGGDTSRVPEA